MKLIITVYKESGKSYNFEVTENVGDIPAWGSLLFEEYIRSIIATKINKGSVVVRDADDIEGLHEHLFEY